MRIAYSSVYSTVSESNGVKHGKGELVLVYAKIVCMPQSLGVTVIMIAMLMCTKIYQNKKALKTKGKKEHILPEFSYLFRRQLLLDS